MGYRIETEEFDDIDATLRRLRGLCYLLLVANADCVDGETLSDVGGLFSSLADEAVTKFQAIGEGERHVEGSEG